MKWANFRFPIRCLSSKPPKQLSATNGNISDFGGRKLSAVSDRKEAKYISFKDFPKAPESVLNLSMDELFSNIYLKPYSDGSSRKKEGRFVDFQIPDKYLVSQRRDDITAKDKAVVEELDRLSKSDEDPELQQMYLSMIKLYYDQETNMYQPEREHILKRSLSGMIKLNPSLEDISNAYLWKIIPKEKSFGVPPYESRIKKDGFKKWEKEQLQRHQEELKRNESVNKEFEEFKKQLMTFKTFFKVRSDGRRKLDRKLLKKYKKLKQQGKIPKDFNLSSFEFEHDL